MLNSKVKKMWKYYMTVLYPNMHYNEDVIKGLHCSKI